MCANIQEKILNSIVVKGHQIIMFFSQNTSKTIESCLNFCLGFCITELLLLNYKNICP